MMAGNKYFVRRLVSGILLVVMAVLCFFEAYQRSAGANKLVALGNSELAQPIFAVAGSGYIMAGVSLIVGIVYCVTANMQPIRWLEYVLYAVVLVVFLLLNFTEGQKFFPDFHLFQFSMLLLPIIGMPLFGRKKSAA